MRVQLIRYFKTFTTDIYIQNDCAHVGLSVHVPVGTNYITLTRETDRQRERERGTRAEGRESEREDQNGIVCLTPHPALVALEVVPVAAAGTGRPRKLASSEKPCSPVDTIIHVQYAICY